MRNSIKKIVCSTLFIMTACSSISLASTGKVIVPAARIREKTDTNSEIILNAYEDDEVEILETLNDWYKIKYLGKEGFVKSSLIKIIDTNDTVSNKVANVSNYNVANTVKKTNSVAKNTVENKSVANATSNSVSNTTNTIDTSVENQQSNTALNSVKEENGKKLVTINQNLKVRNLPSLTSRIVEEYSVGKELTVLSEIKNWVLVSDGITSGWCIKNKIGMEINVPEPEKQIEESPKVENTENSKKEEQNVMENTAKDVASNTVTNSTSDSTPNKDTSSSSKNTGTINVETANLREKASKSSKIINSLDYGDVVNIISEEGDWYKVTCKELSGYVNKSLVTLNETSSRSLETPRESIVDDTVMSKQENENLNAALQNGKVGNEVVEFAKTLLGTKYVSGGTNPDSGFDCSGYTNYIYTNFGKSIGNSAINQANAGRQVSRENLQSGDLIIFNDESNTKIGHTGIYIGDGNFIHAANPQRGVVIDNLNTNTYYNARYVDARNIF